MLANYVTTYLQGLSQALSDLDHGAIWAILEEIMRAWREGRQVFVLGNGGSAALASHMANDLSKAVIVAGMPRLRAISLVDNVPLMTAWANDAGYENAFAEPLRNLCQAGDLVLAVSCSGNSPNVVQALRIGHELGARTVLLTGDHRGCASELADICFAAPIGTVQQQEDVHLALNHVISGTLREWLAGIAERASRPAKALVLAAGEGSRLRPLTLALPKPMLPIRGQPLLEHTLRWLQHHGISEVAINLHYRPDDIAGHFGDGSSLGLGLTYSREDPIMGTAGALRGLDGFLDGSPLVVVYGDVLTDLDLREMLSVHHQNVVRDPATQVTMGLYHVTNPTEVGLVATNGSGRITRFIEKPKPEEVFGDLASAGVLAVEPSIVEHVPPGTFYDFGADLFPALLAKELPLYGWVVPPGSFVLDIGTPEKYALAQSYRPRTGREVRG